MSFASITADGIASNDAAGNGLDGLCAPGPSVELWIEFGEQSLLYHKASKDSVCFVSERLPSSFVTSQVKLASSSPPSSSSNRTQRKELEQVEGFKGSPALDRVNSPKDSQGNRGLMVWICAGIRLVFG